MNFEEDFANFLYRLNQKLTGGKTDDGFVVFWKESFVSYLEENATLVAKQNFKMNQIKPGFVYIQYFKSGVTNSSMDSVRILTAPRNPSYGDTEVEFLGNTRIPIYIADNLEKHRGWPQSIVTEGDGVVGEVYEVNTSRKQYKRFKFPGDYVVPIQKDNMNLMYVDSNGYLKWNGWNTTDLEVWELPASVLRLEVPSLNYPDGGF